MTSKRGLAAHVFTAGANLHLLLIFCRVAQLVEPLVPGFFDLVSKMKYVLVSGGKTDPLQNPMPL